MQIVINDGLENIITHDLYPIVMTTVEGISSRVETNRGAMDRRKRYVRFDNNDADRVRSVQSRIQSRAGEIAADLIDHNSQTNYQGIGDFDAQEREELLEAEREYAASLVNDTFGPAYFESRVELGKYYESQDLNVSVYLGAYGTYFEHILDELVEDAIDSLDGNEESVSGADARETIRELGETACSFMKLINLDQQVAMEAYVESYAMELEQELARQNRVAAEVDTSLDELEASATEVAESSEEIADVTSEQVETTETVSEEVANMSATIEEIASTADQVSSTSEHADTLAAEGREEATEALNAIERVDEATNTVVTDVEHLREELTEIDEFAEVIADIAEQTNILALNASIEAARAGEAGDGFAVVANEIKDLAEQSREHASEIEAAVDDIETKSEKTVASLQTATEEVKTGIQQVEKAMETMREIADAVQETAQGIQEVSAATDDQAASTEEVASITDKLLEQIRTVSDQIEDIAAANEQQAQQIEGINDTVTQLREN